ncbi:3834_t:CDS:2 [Funneliformis caledonium]|uniref:3834_t:CDS:1 n=1 Tax=Funneliformis caledonium TaxID=1117310 RepID=A0A9N8YYF0_9GLOM|nr:3834_t:CDS:2 [Funneliformis caledonium]
MSSQNRKCVFINSNNPSKYQVNINSRPIIKIPFPPVIDPRDLVVKTKDGRVPSRVPNAFIIYRKAFIVAAKNEGYNLPMTVISPMASQSWEQESEIVKTEYKRLAKEAYEVRNEMLPKYQRKKKREKWNIISFKEQSRKRPSPLTQKPTKEINEVDLEVNQPPLLISSPESQSTGFNPVLSQFNFDYTQYMTPDIPSPENSIDFPYETDIESPPESLENTVVLPPIFSQEEFTDFYGENYYQMNYQSYSDSVPSVIDSEKVTCSPDVLEMYAYNAANTMAVESGRVMDFDYSYYL